MKISLLGPNGESYVSLAAWPMPDVRPIRFNGGRKCTLGVVRTCLVGKHRTNTSPGVKTMQKRKKPADTNKNNEKHWGEKLWLLKLVFDLPCGPGTRRYPEVSSCMQACLCACCCPVADRSAPHVCCDAKVPPGGVRFSCLLLYLKERGQPNHPGGVRRCPAACRRVCAPVAVRWRAGVLRMSAATTKCRPEMSGSVASLSL